MFKNVSLEKRAKYLKTGTSFYIILLLIFMIMRDIMVRSVTLYQSPFIEYILKAEFILLMSLKYAGIVLILLFILFVLEFIIYAVKNFAK